MFTNNKSLLLLRGLPGAGKTTLAKILASNNYPCYSIDDYFTNPETEEYVFDFSNNHLAYKQCLDNVEASMKSASEKIFVHNTFTMDWEIEPYFKLSYKYSYKIFIVTVENYHRGKNIHEISDEQLIKMAEKYKVKLL